MLYFYFYHGEEHGVACFGTYLYNQLENLVNRSISRINVEQINKTYSNNL